MSDLMPWVNKSGKRLEHARNLKAFRDSHTVPEAPTIISDTADPAIYTPDTGKRFVLATHQLIAAIENARITDCGRKEAFENLYELAERWSHEARKYSKYDSIVPNLKMLK